MTAHSAPTEQSRQAYGRAVEAVRSAVKELPRKSLAVQDLLIQAAGTLQGLLETEESSLLALTSRSTAGNYLYAHSVNVAILAMHISRGFRWEAAELRALGLCALLHDVERLLRASSIKDSLHKEPQDVQEMRLHPLESCKIFDHVRDIEGSLPRDISEPFAHRMDDQQESRPVPHQRRPVNQGAHVIALCDMYEAISHWRSWREPALPHDALMSLLKQHRRESDQRLIKVFAERLSLYPPGSYVLLSTEDVGRVVEIHPEAPTRPTVAILLRPDGQRVDPVRVVNLAKVDHFNIISAIDETKLSVLDTRLALQLQAGRWWMP